MTVVALPPNPTLLQPQPLYVAVDQWLLTDRDVHVLLSKHDVKCLRHKVQFIQGLF